MIEQLNIRENGCVMTIECMRNVFFKHHTLSVSSQRMYRSALRSLLRYQTYLLATQRINNEIDMLRWTQEMSGDFVYFLLHECELCDAHLQSMRELGGDDGFKPLKRDRGCAAVNNILSMLKSVLRSVLPDGECARHPFLAISHVENIWVAPYYISVAERNLLVSLNIERVFADKHTRMAYSSHISLRLLRVIRDAFIFQCYVGCRYADLRRLTEDNICDGMLVYTPQKTCKKGRQARVPVLKTACELIARHRGKCKRGTLFQLPNNAIYNIGIKLLFRAAGLTRKVEVLDPQTNCVVLKPLCDVASSHLARRTFIGNLYLKVQDPNLIAKMSGHAEGSKAFNRYRKIEDDTLREVMRHLE